MLLRANHKENKVTIGNQVIKLKRGQFVSGRKKISQDTGVQESKVTRILSVFKNEQQVEQQSFSKFSLFSMVNYDKYQSFEQQSDVKVNSKRTADEQQMNTDNNVNNVNKLKEGADAPSKPAPRKPSFIKPSLDDIRGYCTEKKLSMDCESFHDHFESNGWRVGGKSPMKCWKASMRQWAKRDFGNKAKPQGAMQW
jgi:hypothetical protein